MKNSLYSIALFLFIINIHAQNKTLTTTQKQKSLTIEGKITIANQSNLELAYCIANSAMVLGVTNYTTTEEEAIDSAFVQGNYSYNYYVDNYDTEAGTISFNYEYIIKNGEITYTYTDFVHDGTGTTFKSIGNLPEKWNANVGEVFTEKQYSEIMNDVRANIANAVRMVKKYCVN